MDFAVISLVIAVIGIVLQIVDAFPEHRAIRNTIVVMAVGVFVGMAASALLGAQYQVTGNFDSRFGLLFFIGGLAALFALISLWIKDPERAAIAMTFAGVATLVFVAAGFFIGLGSTASSNPGLTDDEVIVLVNEAERRGNYEAAVGYLERLKYGHDERTKKMIDAKIARVRQRQTDQLSTGR